MRRISFSLAKCARVDFNIRASIRAQHWGRSAFATAADARVADARSLLEDAGGGGTVSLDTCRGDGIAVVTIDNAASRNALTPIMMCQFADAVAQLEEEGASADRASSPHAAVVLRGKGGFFCSGADLRVAAKALATPAAGAAMCAFMHHWTSRFRRLPLVSVAAIAGGAVGGGTELATACDHRLMAADAHWCMVHARHGLVPGWGGGARVQRLVGRRAALRLLAGSAKVSAAAALRCGLADGVVDAGRRTVTDGLGFFDDDDDEQSIDRGDGDGDGDGDDDDDAALLRACAGWIERCGYLAWDTAAVGNAKAVVASADDAHGGSLEGALAAEHGLFCEVWPPNVIRQQKK